MGNVTKLSPIGFGLAAAVLSFLLTVALFIWGGVGQVVHPTFSAAVVILLSKVVRGFIIAFLFAWFYNRFVGCCAASRCCKPGCTCPCCKPSAEAAACDMDNKDKKGGCCG